MTNMSLLVVTIFTVNNVKLLSGFLPVISQKINNKLEWRLKRRSTKLLVRKLVTVQKYYTKNAF